MMTVPSPMDAQLIDQGIGTPGRRALLTWLDESLAQIHDDLISIREEKDLRILQGCGQMILELTRGLRDGLRVTGNGDRPHQWTPDPV
jgi:hypothetical protein